VGGNGAGSFPLGLTCVWDLFKKVREGKRGRKEGRRRGREGERERGREIGRAHV